MKHYNSKTKKWHSKLQLPNCQIILSPFLNFDFLIIIGLKNKILHLVFALLLIGCPMLTPLHSYAQAVPDTSLNNIIRDDSIRRREDTPTVKNPNVVADSSIPVTAVKEGPFQPNPKKSGLYSSIIPGLGQLYNRQYWKIPLIYAAMGVTAYVFINNYTNYENYYKAYIGRINNPYPTDKYVNLYTTDQLNQLQNDYNRYMDLTVLFGTIEYALQVMDAITSAHLKNFDISRDISLKMRPVVTPVGIGLGLVVNFKSHPLQQ